MGCDIHLYTEYRDGVRWMNCDNWRLRRMGSEGYTLHPLWEGRNYVLFGILAGVRDTWVARIDDPRGRPEGMSEVVERELDGWDGDAHSISWFTLEEMREFWKRKRKEVIDEEEWEEGVGQLDNLMDLLEERKREVFNLYSDEEGYEEYDARIRVVFWFDN